MTEALFMKDCYLKEFDAAVLESNAESKYVVLDRTIFHETGGGQYSDIGYLEFNGKQTKIKEVKKEKGIVKHYLEGEIPEKGVQVHGVIDWKTRYNIMRMHTAQHLLSAIVLDKYGAETGGNQLHADKSRIDFKPIQWDQEKAVFMVAEFNRLVDNNVPISFRTVTREQMMEEVGEKRRKLFERLPSFIKQIRLVEIQGIDKCPCAGTHVKSTGEIGHIQIQSTENKGKDTTRVIFTLQK